MKNIIEDKLKIMLIIIIVAVLISQPTLSLFAQNVFIKNNGAVTGVITATYKYVVKSDGPNYWYANNNDEKMGESTSFSKVAEWSFGNLTAGRTSQEIVQFNGTFTVDDQVDIPSYTYLNFEGANFKAKNALDKTMFTNNNWGSGNTYITIHGGLIDGNHATFSTIDTTNDVGSGIVFYKTSYCQIIGTEVKECYTRGIATRGSGNNNNKFDHVYVHDCGDPREANGGARWNDMVLAYGHHNTLTNSILESGASDILTLYQEENDIVEGNIFRKSPTEGEGAITIDGLGTIYARNIVIKNNIIESTKRAIGLVWEGAVENIVIDNNTISGMTYGGIMVGMPYTNCGVSGRNCQNITVSNNVLYNSLDGTNCYGISIGSPYGTNTNTITNVHIVNNTIINHYAGGIYVTKGSGTVQNISIQGNTLKNNGYESSYHNIRIDVATNVDIISNHIGPSIAGYDISISANSINVNIKDNDLTGTNKISDSGSSTSIINNTGYNPLGVIAYPVLSTKLVDSGSGTIANNTQYTCWQSPKRIYITGGVVSSIEVNGQKVTDYIVLIQPSNTFKIVWSSAPTIKVVGE